MTTSFVTQPADFGIELAHRTSSGLDVTLYWNQPTDRVTVVVHDHQGGHRFELTVDPGWAGYAFNHPFAYAAGQNRPANAATPQPNGTSSRTPVAFSSAAERRA
jgi:hypothetical protein